MPMFSSGARKPAGPPIFAILLFVTFSALVMIFVTMRQMHSSENHCLRLLAGISQRVENAVEDLTSRFVPIASSESVDPPKDDDKSPVQRKVENIQHLEFISGSKYEGPFENTSRLDVWLQDARLFLRYQGQWLSASERAQPPSDRATQAGDTTPQETLDATSQPEGGGAKPDPKLEDPVDDRPRDIKARIQLKPLIESKIPSGVFDLLVVAHSDGTVVFQHGEPELQVSDVRSVLESADEPAETSFGRASARQVVQIASTKYQVFAQPLVLHLEYAKAEPAKVIELKVLGFVSADRILSSSFASSPILLLALISIFPLALLAWPVLKLWLISPRQRFTRVDAAFLVSSAVIGLSLLTLFLFSLFFYLDLRHLSDRQMEALGHEVEDTFFAELDAIDQQLDAIRRSPCWTNAVLRAASGTTDQSAKKEGRTSSVTDVSTLRKAIEAAREDGSKSGVENFKFEAYPFFMSTFWVDSEGNQRANLPLSRFAVTKSSVASREYFKCAKYDQGFVIPERPQLERRPSNVAGDETAERPAKICLESILSNTSGKSLAAVALPVESAPPACDPVWPDVEPDDLKAVVLATELRSITRPTLPSNVHLAIVGPRGLVQFHSDPSRNLTENLLKASADNTKLRSILADRREALLDINYLGLDHRVYVRPLENVPWSLVVLRDQQELRHRTFEMVLDFFNPFVLCMVAFHVILLLVLVQALAGPREHSGGYFDAIWPDWHKRWAYLSIIDGTAIALGLMAVLVAWPGTEQLVVWPSDDLPWDRDGLLLLFCLALFPATSLGIYGLKRAENRLLRALYRPPDVEIEPDPRHPDEADLPQRVDAWTGFANVGVWGLVALLLLLPDAEGFEVSSWRTALAVFLAAVTALVAWRITDPAWWDDVSRPKGLSLSRFLGVPSPAWTFGIFGLALLLGWRGSSLLLGLLVALGATTLVMRRFVLMRYFKGRRRRVAFVFATTCALLTCSVIPMSGMASLAIDRQREVWVELVQVELARASERWHERAPCLSLARERPLWRLEDAVPQCNLIRQAFKQSSDIEVAASGEATADEVEATGEARTLEAEATDEAKSVVEPQKTVLGGWSEPDYARAFFGSTVQRVERGDGALPDEGRLWFHRGEGVSSRVHFFTRRLVSYSQVVRQALPADPIRFRSPERDWTMQANRLVGAIAPLESQGLVRVESTIPSPRPSFPITGRWSWWLVLFTVAFVLLGSAVVFATVLAEKVLLVSLVPYGGAPQKLDHVLTLLDGRVPGYLVTAVPDLVVGCGQSLAARTVALGDLVSDWRSRSRTRDKWSTSKNLFDTLETRGPLDQVLLVTDFSPSLDSGDAIDEEIAMLSSLVERGQRLLLVSRIDPRDFETKGLQLSENGPRFSTSERWARFFSRFAIFYSFERADEGADGLEPATRYFRELYTACRGTRPRDLNGREKGIVRLIAQECSVTGQLECLGRLLTVGPTSETKGEPEAHGDLMAPRLLISHIAHVARAYYQGIWSGCRTDERVVLYQLARDRLVNPKNYNVVNDLALKGLVLRDPRLRIMNRSFARFVLNTVDRATLVQWEEADGTSAWNVFKWLLPLPLLLLGGYLFVTQPSAFSNVIGLVVALGSIVPMFHNLFEYFQKVAARRELAASERPDRRGAEPSPSPSA